MMRIASSATNCIKGVFFVQPFLRNWPGNLAPVRPPEERRTTMNTILNLLYVELKADLSVLDL